MHSKIRITHFLYQSLDQITVINKYWSLLFGATFFYLCLSTTAYAVLKVAVVDTGFCREKTIHLSENQKILPVLDVTGDNFFDCTDKKDIHPKRLHGQEVLNVFLGHLKKEMEVEIWPIVIFNNRGEQKKDYWEKAIKIVEDEKIDIVLTASGFIDGEKIVRKLPGIWFVPSGRIDKEIKRNTILFPQNLAPLDNLFVIGNYFIDEKNPFYINYDQNLLYQKVIDYYFPAGSDGLVGTSRAVGEGVGKAISLCYIDFRSLRVSQFRTCLERNSRLLNDSILKRSFKTY